MKWGYTTIWGIGDSFLETTIFTVPKLNFGRVDPHFDWKLYNLDPWNIVKRPWKYECHTVFFGWGWKFKRQISRSCNQKHSKIEVDDRDLITLKRCFVSQLVQDSWNTPSHQHYQILIYKQFTSCLPPAYGLFLLFWRYFICQQQKHNQELPPYFKTTPQHVVFSRH